MLAICAASKTGPVIATMFVGLLAASGSMAVHGLPYAKMPTVADGTQVRRCIPEMITRFDSWLGRQDSNLRMAASKAAALPLGDAPTSGGD